MKSLLKWLKRAVRRRQSDIVRVLCPSCNEMIDAYKKHQCVMEVK